MKNIKLGQIDIKEVEDTIKGFIVDNVLEFNATGVVLGLSGGVDSTLVANLSKKAFDEYNIANGTNLKVRGYIMPSSINELDDQNDALYVAKTLGIDCEIIPIEPFVEVYDANINGIKQSAYNRGNLMSRIRANILHTNASLENKLVIGTGNRDEDFCIGYYTLFGDGAVHMSPIGDLSKRHVKEMVSHYGFDNIVSREPTAGLEEGQTDFKDLGYSYEIAELIVEGLKQGISIEDLNKHCQVIDKFREEQVFSKFNQVSQVVEDVIFRHEIAKKKANLVSPRICNVNKRYL